VTAVLCGGWVVGLVWSTASYDTATWLSIPSQLINGPMKMPCHA